MAPRTYLWVPDTDSHLQFSLSWNDTDDENLVHTCTEALINGFSYKGDKQEFFEKTLAFNNATNFAKGFNPEAVVTRQFKDGTLELNILGLDSNQKTEVETFLKSKFGFKFSVL